MKNVLSKIAPFVPGLAVAGCLGLALGLLFFWTRSFYTTESYRGRTRAIFGIPTLMRVRTGEGTFGLLIDRFAFPNDAQAAAFPQAIDTTNRFWIPGYSRRRPGPPITARPASSASLLGSLGFQFYRTPTDDFSGSRHTQYALALPFWALFFLAMGYPLIRYVGGVVQRQREERLALGLCPTCGTPMNPDYSRCPGCDKPLALARLT